MERFAKNFRNETKDGLLRFPKFHPLCLAICVNYVFAKGKPVSDIFSVVDGGGHGWKVVDLLKSGKNTMLESKKELASRVFDINMKMF